jgi:hypothetical protein
MPTSSPKEGRSSSSPEFRRSSRLRKPVDRLDLLNSTKTIDPKVFEMFDSTPCPKGSKQITFQKTDQPPRVTRESINQQFLSKHDGTNSLTLARIPTARWVALSQNIVVTCPNQILLTTSTLLY